MNIKSQSKKIRSLKAKMRYMHNADTKIYYCDMLMALAKILKEHRTFYEKSIKKK